MRAVAYSTRQIIRLATVLAATASLLLALAAPFMGTAHAELDEDSFIIFTNVQDGHANEGEKSEPITFRVDSSDSRTTGGDLFLDTFPYTNDTNKLHISCSSSLVGVTAVTTEGHPWGAGVQVEIASLSDYYIFRHHVAEQGNNRCGEGTLPGGGDDQPDPDPVSTTLTLIKVVVGGEAEYSDFSPIVSLGDDVLDGFEFGSQDNADAVDVEPGTYALGEEDDDDYDLTGIVCDNDASTEEGETTLDVTLEAGDEVTCTFTNVAKSSGGDPIIPIIPIIPDPIITIVPDPITPELIEVDAPEDVAVLDDVAVADEEAAAVDEDVAVLDEVATADELPATGLETIHLALLAALFAALGVLFLLGTETDKVRAYRA